VPREITPRNDRLYTARYDAGLTQTDLAKAADVSRQRVNEYERLKAQPSPETAQKIALVLTVKTGRPFKPSDLFPTVTVTARDVA
jgi:transcriptional regulator with XRE-family HTH domain